MFSRYCFVFTMLSFLSAASVFSQSPIIEQKIPKMAKISDQGEQQAIAAAEISPLEIKLFERFQRTESPDEVFAFEEEGVGAGWTHLTEIIVRGGNAEMRFYPDDCALRYFHRKLTDDELKSFLAFLAEKSVDHMKDYAAGSCDGIGYMYLRMTKHGGHRLYMENPPDEEFLRQTDTELKADDPTRNYCDLVKLLKQLADPDKLEVKYLTSRKQPELKVMYAHPKNEIRAVWAKGDDVRVLIGEYQLTPQKWVSLRKGKLGAEVERPESFPAEGDDSQVDNLTTPDGRWRIGRQDKKLVSFDLTAKKEIPLDDIEVAKSYHAIYYLPVQKRVLLVCPRQRDTQLTAPLSPCLEQHPATYRLLNPTTGKTTTLPYLEGSMPLRQIMHHTFQPAGQPGLIWVARKETGYTMLGKFNTTTLQYDSWARIDTLEFDSESIWIDETAQKVYIVYRGHLLQLPNIPTLTNLHSADH